MQCDRMRAAPQRKTYVLDHESNRRIAVNKKMLTIAAALALSIAGGAAAFAAELPTFEVKGFPISPVQAGLLGAANVRETQAVPSAVSRPRLNTATAAQITTGAGH
jgi:hypothetical protein